MFAGSEVASTRPTWYAGASVVYLAAPLALRRWSNSRAAWLAWLWGLAMLLPFAGLAGFGPVGRLLYVRASVSWSHSLSGARDDRGHRRGGLPRSRRRGLLRPLTLFLLPRE